jgi:hypothetical protein
MLILRFFCENNPRIIAASGTDPAVLKIRQCALITGSRQAEYTSVILHPVDGTLTKYLNTCVTIFGNNQKRNTHFVTR